MKKLILICALLTVGNNLAARTIDISMHDKELISLGVIGNDYKYTSIEKASEYFSLENKKVNDLLPIQVGKFSELISSEATPYALLRTYRYFEDLTPEEKKDLTKDLITKEILIKICDGEYNSRFLFANNYVIKQKFVDKEYVELLSVTLDKYTCI